MKLRRLRVILLLLLPGFVFASPPKILNFQSKLTDSAGVGINDTVDITFRLYDVATGGTPLWTETHASVPVVKGLFDVALGSVSPFPDSMDFSGQYYLEIQVESETLAPRIPFRSSPYAVRAIFADSAAAAGVNWDTLGAYWDTTNNFVKAIVIEGDTTLTDTFVIKAGSGIDFSRSRDTLTIISSTGSNSVVLQPQYPSVVFANLAGASNDSVWIRTHFDESTGNSFYQLSGAYGHDDQQYNIVAFWQLPEGATALDSIKTYYQTADDTTENNSVSFEIKLGSDTLTTSGGELTGSTVSVWVASSGLSSVAPGDMVQIVALLKADSDKWARIGEIEIYYH
ncbi:hypothetical protein J7K99_01590 [bacterium]|nr:hypothetical protein [bacterium]